MSNDENYIIENEITDITKKTRVLGHWYRIK